MRDLNEPHTVLREASREQTLPAEIRGDLVVESIQLPSRHGFFGNILDLGHLGLHTKRQIERFYSPFKFWIRPRPAEMLSTDFTEHAELPLLECARNPVILEVAHARTLRGYGRVDQRYSLKRCR